MYITCPGCKTRFAVTAEQIGNNGRKVKCSKCFNIWHQEPFRQARIEPKIELLPPVVKPDAALEPNIELLLPLKLLLLAA